MSAYTNAPVPLSPALGFHIIDLLLSSEPINDANGCVAFSPSAFAKYEIPSIGSLNPYLAKRVSVPNAIPPFLPPDAPYNNCSNANSFLPAA